MLAPLFLSSRISFLIGYNSSKLKSQINDKEIKRLEAIINSMTAHERRFPAVIKGSRKVRIANGSGTQVQDVNPSTVWRR